MAETILAPGRYGSNRPDGPGVTLRLRDPLSIFSVIARKGKGEALAAALRERFGLERPGPGLCSARVGRELRLASFHELKERLPGRRQLTLAVFYHGIEELSLDAG